MRLFTIICAICFILSACSAPNEEQTASPVKKEDASVPADSLPFPKSWIGNWQGTLEIFKENQVVQTVPMALEIQEIDSSDNIGWAIIYGEDKVAGRRPYELETIDASKGQYRIDEKNTIFLESYFYRDKLLCWYEVMGNQILSTYEKNESAVIFEIIFGDTEPVSVTGDQKHEGEDIPAVSTFPIGGYQRAVLTRE